MLRSIGPGPATAFFDSAQVDSGRLLELGAIEGESREEMISDDKAGVDRHGGGWNHSAILSAPTLRLTGR